MSNDYRALKTAELADVSDFLHDLSDAQWDVPSLCEGWKVRDVVSHLTVGYTVPLRVVAGRAGGFVASKKRVAGLRLVAIDIDHEVGAGPEVRGTAETLALAATGRSVAIDELDGDGVEILRTRIKG